MKWPWQRRRRQIEESREAIRRQERLGEIIEWQRAEAAEIGKWARERLEANHLTDLFLSTRGNRR